MIGYAGSFQLFTFSFCSSIVSFFPYGLLSELVHFFEGNSNVFLFLNTNFGGDNVWDFFFGGFISLECLTSPSFSVFSAAAYPVTRFHHTCED